MKKEVLFIGFFCVLITSCSVQRFLPPGEKLYRGATIKVDKNKETTTSAKSLKSKLSLAVTPKPNKFLFGQPYKVWLWYKIGEPESPKSFRGFLRNKIAEPPVLSSRINTKSTAENMQSLMENLGYFRTTVQGDTTNTGSYFMKAHYTAQVQPQYHVGKVEWVDDSSALIKVLKQNSLKSGLLKPGNPYTLSDIAAERDRLDLFLKTRGYYYFNPDYLMVYADSTVGGRKVDMLLNIKKTTPATARYPYTINSIKLFPNYSLAPGQLDTTKTNFEIYDHLEIKDPHYHYRPRLFASTVTYRPESIYSSRQQNTTLNRFITLGTFKFVKNRFEPIHDTTNRDTSHRMNVYYYLTPAKRNSLQAELDAFAKENNYVGTQVSVNWKNRNFFKGAEQLGVKVYGGFESTSGDSVKNTDYHVGTDISLKVPRYVTPFFRIKENNFYAPSTSFLLGYELYRKSLFYTKNLFRFEYASSWKPNIQKQYSLSPVSISYLQATGITDSFKHQELLEPALVQTVYSEVILGTNGTYTFNSNFRSKKNKVYFNGGIDLSGNIAGLITGAKTYRSKTILGVPFAQYVKLDADYHYTRKLSNNYDWANRLLVGIGLPYSNSKMLPFTKQYTIGGSSSIRGFRSNTLGPGAYKPSGQDQRFFQFIGGDYKLLANTELRIPFTSIISGAIFLDAGNIWTKDTLLFGPKAKLTKDFYKELAVASGIGLRFDVTVLLIRVDLGVPLRKPYLPDGQRWVLNQINFGSSSWRRENLILNIAIGLPF